MGEMLRPVAWRGEVSQPKYLIRSELCRFVPLELITDAGSSPFNRSRVPHYFVKLFLHTHFIDSFSRFALFPVPQWAIQSR